jgi:transcriptional regulator of arginine metabolism
MIISSREVGNQDDLLKELAEEGYQLTQATLSRDLKQLKVAKASNSMGKPVYVLPNNTMYKRIKDHRPAHEMMMYSGFISLNFSGNMAVIRTRPGYASSIAYDIDRKDIPQILGTIAGDDTILFVIEEGVSYTEIKRVLGNILPI